MTWEPSTFTRMAQQHYHESRSRHFDQYSDNSELLQSTRAQSRYAATLGMLAVLMLQNALLQGVEALPGEGVAVIGTSLRHNTCAGCPLVQMCVCVKLIGSIGIIASARHKSSTHIHSNTGTSMPSTKRCPIPRCVCVCVCVCVLN